MDMGIGLTQEGSGYCFTEDGHFHPRKQLRLPTVFIMRSGLPTAENSSHGVELLIHT